MSTIERMGFRKSVDYRGASYRVDGMLVRWVEQEGAAVRVTPWQMGPQAALPSIFPAPPSDHDRERICELYVSTVNGK